MGRHLTFQTSLRLRARGLQDEREASLTFTGSVLSLEVRLGRIEKDKSLIETPPSRAIYRR
jgi:3-phenylpropionate/cinnamic acid dioxygenase small subunit